MPVTSPETPETPLEVLVVAALKDYDLTAQCLLNLEAYFPGLGQVYLATDSPSDGRALVGRLGLAVTVLSDRDFLSDRELRLDGWYRQQIIKLRAGRVLARNTFCVMSGDTLLARPINRSELVAPDGRPYLQVNRYRHEPAHLEYERQRVHSVAKLLGVTPRRSLELGDFICDLFCFERDVVSMMVERLNVRYPDGWTRLLEGRTKTSGEEGRFGEYTMYSVAALELAETPPPVRVCRETHVLQLHSARAFRLASFDSAIIHLVDKTISFDDLASKAATFGQELRPARGRR